MSKTTPILVVAFLVIIVLVVAGLVLANNANQKQSDTMVTPSPTVSAPLTSTPSTPTTTLPQNTQNNGGRYIDYDSSLVSFAGEGKVVLFFHAAWCPSCILLNSNLAGDNSNARIPSDLLIMKVDYDSSQELKQKYGVTLQHTLVQVDAKGEKIKSWNGLYNQYLLEDILSELN